PRTTAGIVTAAVPRNNTFIKPTARNESKANYLVPLDKREMRLEKNSNRCKRSPSPGSPWVDAGDELQRIFVIDFLEYLVWELKAIDSPESVTLAVILKVFVAGLQSAEIPFVFIHIVDVLTHQHAILIFHQKIMRRIGLAPQLSEHGGDVHVHI